MNHSDADQLLKSALNLLENEEENQIHEHLGQCKICSEKMDKIINEVKVLSSFDPVLEPDHYSPSIVKKPGSVWLKRAVIILFVSFSAYSILELSSKREIEVVQQSLQTKTQNLSEVKYITCQNVDIW